MSECDSSQLASFTGDTGQQPPSSSEPSAPEVLPLQPQPGYPNVVSAHPNHGGPDVVSLQPEPTTSNVVSPYPQPSTDALCASPGPALATTGPPSYSEVIKHQQQQPGVHPFEQATHPLQQSTYPFQQGVYPLQQGMYPPQQNVYPHQLGAAPVQPVQPQSAHQSLGTRLVYTEPELTQQDSANRNRAFKCIICIVVLIVIIVIVAITGIIVGVVSSQNRL